MPFINLYLFLLLLIPPREMESNGNSLDHGVGALSPVEINEKSLTLHPDVGMMYRGVSPFTGASLSYYATGQLAERTEYQAGKKNGKFQKWFEDGSIAFEANYSSNKLNGPVKSWWSNGNIRSSGNFLNGRSDGLQQQWYSSGAKFKEMNISDGKEEGMQRAWRENGKIYVNYEAKNGRIYGLKRSNLCFELDDETVIRND